MMVVMVIPRSLIAVAREVAPPAPMRDNEASDREGRRRKPLIVAAKVRRSAAV
jgi:hypothetical protein